MIKRGYILILFLLIPLIIYNISATQTFLNQKISYEYGKFTPEIREGAELNDYFKKLNLQEDYIYVLLGFKEIPNKSELSELKKDNIKQIGKYSKDFYVYKFPKEILETKTYDFVKWIDVPKKWDKMDRELKDSLNLNNSLYVKVEFYENYTDNELVKLNKYSKFTNKDAWEEREIYVLVAPKISLDSIHPVEEVASFNFVKSIKLIDVRDKRQINLYINQSDFYKNKSLVNQPHGICPWQRDDKKIGNLEKKNISKIISQENISNDKILGNINKDLKLKETYNYAKELGLDYNRLSNSTKVVYDDGTISTITLLNDERILNNSELVFLIDIGGKIKKSYLMSLIQENETLILKMFDKFGGVKINFNNFSLIESWGEHSCAWEDCVNYAAIYFYDVWWNTPCKILCEVCLGTWNPDACVPCGVCLSSISLVVVDDCDNDPCEYYPCQQDCDDQDGWSENWYYYCNGDDIWRGKWNYNYECSSSMPREGSCTYDLALLGQTESYQSCDYGCTSGSCDSEIECYSNSDCPADGWTGSTYCSSGDVWQTYRDYSCVSNTCVYNDDNEEKRDCNNGCSGGSCITGECASEELEEDCNNGEDERVELIIGDGEAYSASGWVEICGDNYCNPNLGFATDFDIDDCDGILNESMKENITQVLLEWENEEGDSCENTDLYFYTNDEDDLSNPEENQEDLTNVNEWEYIDELPTSCSVGSRHMHITDQYIDDLILDDDDQIAYAWWPESNQDQWFISSSQVNLDIEYCKECPDEDSDNYNDEDYECGTENDCNDYNQYINPGSNIYCDCNSGTGGGATQGTYEICDNIDNDCDGSTDESLSQGCGIGVCAGGIQSCSAGSWGSCSTNYLITNETCNNLDDDCDGSVDENIGTQECGTDIGICVTGTQSCSSGGWGACGGAYVGPTNETCNSLDDNCNGIVDEDNVCGDYPNTTIMGPMNNYISSSGNVTFTCSSFDNNGLANITLFHNITGNMTANWTKLVTGISNTTTWVLNNISNQTSFIWNCLVYDINAHWSWSENGPYHVSVILGPPADSHKFYIHNSTGAAVAWLGNLGNIVLKGSCFSGGNCDNPGPDSFIIRNITNENVAFINSTGDLCIESGDCSDENATCDTNPENAFIIKNSSNNNVIYIDKFGELCLTGKLYQNSNP